MKKPILAPSILSADLSELGKEIKITEKVGAQYLHIDIMDGAFVPNISFGAPVVQAIKNTTAQVKDVHLMIEEPVRYVEMFAKAGADIITVHIEACKDVVCTLEKIHELGVKAGITLKPGTSTKELEPYLPYVDMVLIMSVEPGFGGQAFQETSLDRVAEVKEMIEKQNRSIDIEIDGGVGLGNVESILDAGVDIVIAGNSIFSGDTEENTKRFMEILENYGKKES